MMILKEIKNIFIKNRLTEGVDFVRKEWLRSTGGAQIGLKYTNNGNYEIELKGKDLKSVGKNESQILGGTFIWNSGLFTIAISKSTGNLMFANNSVVYPSAFQEFTLKVTPSENAGNLDVDINNTIYQITKKKLSLTKLFYWYRGNVTQYTEGCIGHLKVDNYCNMYPCQLLKSIPASLDANNKSRAAGECGMYDSITGKFYGNVASTGTFTVEGEVEPETHTGLQQIYQNKLIEGIDYETYDWLKADIPISTTMMTLPISSKNFEFKRNFIQIMNSAYFKTSDSNLDYFYIITDYDDDEWSLYPQIWSTQSTIRSSIKVRLGIHTIIANDNEVTISRATNTATLPWYGNPTYIMFFNARNRDKNTIHLTSSIKVDGVTRYVPSRLLHSIPRNLDAQYKERVASECGMIDLISGKFYGNITNSGLFTVVNEYDDWLKNCSILFDPSTAAVYTNYYPPHYEFYGRVEVAKLTSEFVNFGFVQISNTQVKVGSNVFNADFGTDKWATFIVRYRGGNSLNVEVNGVDLGSPSYPTNYSWAPHIYLYDIMQINKIEMWIYPRQVEPTYSCHDSWIPRLDVEVEGYAKQYLTNDSDRTFRIYAD